MIKEKAKEENKKLLYQEKCFNRWENYVSKNKKERRIYFLSKRSNLLPRDREANVYLLPDIFFYNDVNPKKKSMWAVVKENNNRSVHLSKITSLTKRRLWKIGRHIIPLKYLPENFKKPSGFNRTILTKTKTQKPIYIFERFRDLKAKISDFDFRNIVYFQNSDKGKRNH